jgi:hypothetical protein
MADLQRKAVSTVMEERSEPANVGDCVWYTGIDVRSPLLCEKCTCSRLSVATQKATSFHAKSHGDDVDSHHHAF